MHTQNIILIDGPHVISDMLKRVIAKTPGLQLVAEVKDGNELIRAISQIDIDWIIYILSPGEQVPEAVNEVLVRDASKHLMIIEADGSRVWVKWFEPQEAELSQKNLQEILRILVENKPVGHLQEKF